MVTLIVVGFLAGVITSLSPCVLPVLPVVLAASASARAAGDVDAPAPARMRAFLAGRRRPIGVVAGLMLSFSASTLFGSVVLSALHLPQDLLRTIGIVVLTAVGLGLIVPRLGELVERPFARLSPRRAVNPDSSGLVIGLGLGLLFVPCAGPVLATIAVVGATHHIGVGAIVLTAAFGIGVGAPLLLIALAGDGIARRTGVLRRRAKAVRLGTGLVMVCWPPRSRSTSPTGCSGTSRATRPRCRTRSSRTTPPPGSCTSSRRPAAPVQGTARTAPRATRRW